MDKVRAGEDRKAIDSVLFQMHANHMFSVTVIRDGVAVVETCEGQDKTIMFKDDTLQVELN